MTVSEAEPLHLAAALEGAGWHPAAWREPGARPAELLTAGYWADLVTEAERGLLDFVTFSDALSLQSDSQHQPDTRTDQVRGRLDAVLTAARIAPLTSHIGLIPAVTVTHTEPFHLRSIRTGEGAIDFPTPDETRSHSWTEQDRALVADRVDTQFAGSPKLVAAQLEQLCDATGADELIVTTITHDHADRVRSYQLLAQE